MSFKIGRDQRKDKSMRMDASYKPALPRVGLALGSGVARGFGHIGVLRALEARGVPIDVVAGTSIGALAGGAYLAGKLDTFEEWALSLARRRFWRYLDLGLRGGGLVAGTRLFALLAEQLGHIEIEHLERPFVAVATDLTSGHEVWLRRGPLAQAIRASCALPGIFPPVGQGQRWLVDGAMVNPVPISACRALDARLVIAVNLNADSFGRRRMVKPSAEAGIDHDLERGQPADSEPVRPARRRWLVRRQRPSVVVERARHPAPGMLSVIASAFDIVQDRLTRSRLAGEPPDLTIAPRLDEIGFLDFERASDMIAAGKTAVEKIWPALEEALATL